MKCLMFTLLRRKEEPFVFFCNTKMTRNVITRYKHNKIDKTTFLDSKQTSQNSVLHKTYYVKMQYGCYVFTLYTYT